MHGESDHPQPRLVREHLTGCLDSIEIRHAHVHDDHVGLLLLGELQRASPVFRLTHDFHALLLFQQRAQTIAHDLVIVSKKNPYRHFSLPSRVTSGCDSPSSRPPWAARDTSSIKAQRQGERQEKATSRRLGRLWKRPSRAGGRLLEPSGNVPATGKASWTSFRRADGPHEVRAAEVLPRDEAQLDAHIPCRDKGTPIRAPKPASILGKNKGDAEIACMGCLTEEGEEFGHSRKAPGRTTGKSRTVQVCHVVVSLVPGHGKIGPVAFPGEPRGPVRDGPVFVLLKIAGEVPPWTPELIQTKDLRPLSGTHLDRPIPERPYLGRQFLSRRRPGQRQATGLSLLRLPLPRESFQSRRHLAGTAETVPAIGSRRPPKKGVPPSVEVRRVTTRSAFAFHDEPPGGQTAEEDAGGVEIGTGIDAVGIDFLLRRGVVRRAHHEVVRPGEGFAPESRQSEITDLHPVVVGQKDIRGFEVPVDDAGLVKAGKSSKDLPTIVEGFVEAQDARGILQPVGLADHDTQVVAVVRHDEEGPYVRLTVIPDGHDVGVSEPPEGQGLALEPAADPIHPNERHQVRVGSEKLESRYLSDCRDAHLVDRAHAALAKETADLVTSDPPHENPPRLFSPQVSAAPLREAPLLHLAGRMGDVIGHEPHLGSLLLRVPDHVLGLVVPVPGLSHAPHIDDPPRRAHEWSHPRTKGKTEESLAAESDDRKVMGVTDETDRLHCVSQRADQFAVRDLKEIYGDRVGGIAVDAAAPVANHGRWERAQIIHGRLGKEGLREKQAVSRGRVEPVQVRPVQESELVIAEDTGDAPLPDQTDNLLRLGTIADTVPEADDVIDL